MNKTIITVTLTLLISTIDSSAQIQTRETPRSMRGDDKINNLRSKGDFTPVNLKLEKSIKDIEAEDLVDESNGMPPRFGYEIDVNLNLKNSGC